jgi:hypothetical protein
VLSNVVRSKQKGPFTSTDGELRKSKNEAEVKLKSLVEEHENGIAKVKTFVDSQGGVVLACVFYSLPTSQGAIRGLSFRKYERGLVLWIREQSEYCQDPNYNKGGAGATPLDVATCGGSAWFTGGPVEVVQVQQARVAAPSKWAPVRAAGLRRAREVPGGFFLKKKAL